ncbi:MAG: hypothetical protein QW343_03675 [Candidatus Norongarragalinales archaeon]
MGLTTEVVTARNENALADYVASKGLTLPSEAKNALSGYFGKEYSFVIAWISDVEKFKSAYSRSLRDQPLGVFVSFPTEKLFFPLKPTSVYGETLIPIALYVTGHVTPALSEEIKGATRTSYFVQNNYAIPDSLEEFFGKRGVLRDFAYTKIEIHAPASELVEDLWVNASSPPKIALEYFAARNFWLFFAIVFAVTSCLASAVAALIVFRGRKPNTVKFALLGLTNFLTIFGFYVAASKLKIDDSFVTRKPVPTPPKKNFEFSITVTLVSALLLAALVFSALSGSWVLLFLPAALTLFLLLTTIIVVLRRLATGKSSATPCFTVVFSLIFLVLTLALEFALKNA